MTENSNLDDNSLLNDFVKNNEYKEPEVHNANVIKEENIGNSIRREVKRIDADSNFVNIPLADLPYGAFYDDGVKISIRPTKTKEIQSFAVVNEKNPYDVIVKLNELLSACVKIENIATNDVMNHTDLIDGDRDTITLLIAKISSKFGKKIEKLVKCACNADVKLEMIPANYIYKSHHEKLLKYFNTSSKRYEFKLKNGALINLAPPTLGLIQDINNYMLVKATKSGGKETPNITFMQTLPFIEAGKGVKSLDFKQLEQKEYDFTKMNDELFMFVYDCIDMLSFGITECKVNCTCGREVRTGFGFPDGARSLFVIHNSFDELIG